MGIKKPGPCGLPVSVCAVKLCFHGDGFLALSLAISSLALVSSSCVVSCRFFNERWRIAWIKAAPRHHNTTNNVIISPMPYLLS